MLGILLSEGGGDDSELTDLGLGVLLLLDEESTLVVGGIVAVLLLLLVAGSLYEATLEGLGTLFGVASLLDP